MRACVNEPVAVHTPEAGLARSSVTTAVASKLEPATEKGTLAPTEPNDGVMDDIERSAPKEEEPARDTARTARKDADCGREMRIRG